MECISVIIPALKSGELLARAVASVLDVRQGVRQLECVVVTADSDKNISPEGVRDARVTIIPNVGSGPGHAVNQGLLAASGSIIGVLSGDDCYLPGTLATVANAFDENPGMDVLYGNATYIDQQDDVMGRVRIRRPTVANLSRNPCLCSSAVFFRRELASRFGPWDESLRFWASYEWWARLAQAGVRFGGRSQVLSGKRIHPENRITRIKSALDELSVIEEFIALQRRLFGGPGPWWALRYGRLMAKGSRHTRSGSIAYDVCTLRLAMRISDSPRESTFQRWKQNSRLLSRHVGTELRHIVKRPRLVFCVLPGAMAKPLQRILGRRIFRLKVDEPYRGQLPATYFRTARPANAPVISIATPNLNQGPFIERTIRSVLDQRYPRLEFVVQDGGSHDESVDVIRRYEWELASWESTPDNGQAQAINRGLSRTSGEIMAYLNSDDVLLPGSLNHVANFFQTHPEIDVIYGNRILIDDNDCMINRWVLPAHDNDTITWADFIPQETMFWRRKAWDAVGAKFDESFHFAMDWDLILRFRAAGLKFAHIPRFLGAFRITDGQKTNQMLKSVGLAEMSRLRRRELGRDPSERELRQHVRGYIRRQWYREKLRNMSELIEKWVYGSVEWPTAAAAGLMPPHFGSDATIEACRGADTPIPPAPTTLVSRFGMETLPDTAGD
ncbi:MAG: glycosyltransferase [Planctomycetota bacterium]|nr:glycosyltransferase [Planctomycetota bacterium]